MTTKDTKKKDIADSIMEKIEKEAIAPKPRWEFLLKNYLIWAVGFLALLVGGIATSSVIFAFRNGDWALYRRLSGGLLPHIFAVLPAVWLVLLVVFVALAIYQIQHTKRGYRYPLSLILGAIVMVSWLLGFWIYAFGYAYLIDTHVGRIFPAYRGLEERREERWNRPEEGIIAGVVIGTTTDTVYSIRAFSGEVWEVSIDRLEAFDAIVLSSANEVGIVGNKTGTSTFEACAVRPWGIAGEHERMREEMRALMRENGIVPPQEGMPTSSMPHMGPRGPEVLRLRLKEQGLDERNLDDLRTIMCERVATGSQTYPGSE